MFAQAMHFATTPLRLVNADRPSCDYGDARVARFTRTADCARHLRARRAETELPMGGQQNRRREPPLAGWVMRGLNARGQNAQSAVEMRNERFDLRLEFARRDGRLRTVDGRASRAPRGVA